MQPIIDFAHEFNQLAEHVIRHLIKVWGFVRAPPRKNKSLAQEGLLINLLGTSLRQHMVKVCLLEYIHRFSCLS